jgi:type IV secretion system protein VirB9
MKSHLFLALGLLCLGSPALAKDPRLAARPYNPDEVVRIDGQLGVQASIAFAEDERIENVAVGDSASWQITPNKRANLLFVKPLAGKARTNMTVITDRRTYFFDLVSGMAVKPLYVLRFSYPDEPKPEPQQAATPALNEAEAKLAEGEKPVDPAMLNFQWARRGDARIQPVQLYDDGQSTYLTWARDVPLPAILIRDEKGTEGPVNYAVRGDTIVIEGVPSPIFLRAGRNAAQLDYRGPTRAAPAPSAPALAAAATKDQ